MNVVVIHGQSHKGVTYTMTSCVLKHLVSDEDNVSEFFLPTEGPGFCYGCCQCFLKGESYCPDAQKVQPIMQAIQRADIIIIDSPNYVMEMSGGLKALFDHMAYRWITHRPDGSMFSKVGLAVSSSAGSPASHTTKSIAKQLRWLCVPKVYRFPMICSAMSASDLSQKKKAAMDKKAKRLAIKLKQKAGNQKAGIRERFMFMVFRSMQASPTAAWNKTDQDWWIQKGWNKSERPWK